MFQYRDPPSRFIAVSVRMQIAGGTIGLIIGSLLGLNNNPPALVMFAAPFLIVPVVIHGFREYPKLFRELRRREVTSGSSSGERDPNDFDAP